MFAGITIAQFGNYFVEFLEKAWNSGGQTKPATHALSRGLGAALIELAMYLGFGILKAAGKAAKAIAKGAIKIGKQIFKGIIRGVKFLIEKAKVIFKGIAGKGLGKLSKSMRKLADDLLEHTRFKKFRIRFEGRRFLLEAFVNPWVLLATGDLKEVESTAGHTVGQQGKFVTKEGKEVEGILVTARNEKNAFTQAIKDGKGTYDELLHLESDAARSAKIFGGKPFDYEQAVKDFGKDVADAMKRSDNLAKALGKAPSDLHRAHHMMPVELLGENKVLQKAVEEGFEFNGKANGKWLKQYSSQFDDLIDGVHASHPEYTKRVSRLIEDILEQRGKTIATLGKGEAKSIIEEVIQKVDAIIEKSPKTKINLLVF